MAYTKAASMMHPGCGEANSSPPMRLSRQSSLFMAILLSLVILNLLDLLAGLVSPVALIPKSTLEKKATIGDLNNNNNNNNTMSSNDNTILSGPYSCAPWIPAKRRKIYISWMNRWSFNTFWERFQDGRGHVHGESYWLVSLEYVLKDLGFELVQGVDYTALRALRQGRAHLFLRAGENLKVTKMAKKRLGPSIAQETQVTCKLRSLQWWNELMFEEQPFYFDEDHPYDSRQLISPFDDFAHNRTFSKIPFFVHSQVTLPPVKEEEATRQRKGFALIRGANPDAALMIPLLKAGFQMHTTINPDSEERQILDAIIPPQYQSQLVHHGRLKGPDYSRLMRSMAFVFGIGTPTDSPTPYEGLYNGAAFLNPIHDTEDGWTQHRQLVKEKPPYVYNYRLHNETDLVQAAEAAYRNRFASYLPEENTVQHVKEAVCRILIEQADEICSDAVQKQGETSGATSSSSPPPLPPRKGVLDKLSDTIVDWAVWSEFRFVNTIQRYFGIF